MTTQLLRDENRAKKIQQRMNELAEITKCDWRKAKLLWIEHQNLFQQLKAVWASIRVTKAGIAHREKIPGYVARNWLSAYRELRRQGHEKAQAFLGMSKHLRNGIYSAKLFNFWSALEDQAIGFSYDD